MSEAKKPIPPRPRPGTTSDEPSLFSGRLWLAVALLVGLGVMGNPVFNNWVIRDLAPPEDVHTDSSKWALNAEGDVRVTVITADSTRLACASAESVDGAHCQFSGDKLPWPAEPNAPVDDNGPNLIQPYRTSPENLLVMVIGLWAVPDVAMRLHREPPTTIATKRLGRFDITCHVKFVGKFDQINLRWDVGNSWQTERAAWIVRPLSCTVVNS